MNRRSFFAGLAGWLGFGAKSSGIGSCEPELTREQQREMALAIAYYWDRVANDGAIPVNSDSESSCDFDTKFVEAVERRSRQLIELHKGSKVVELNGQEFIVPSCKLGYTHGSLASHHFQSLQVN